MAAMHFSPVCTSCHAWVLLPCMKGCLTHLPSHKIMTHAAMSSGLMCRGVYGVITKEGGRFVQYSQMLNFSSDISPDSVAATGKL